MKKLNVAQLKKIISEELKSSLVELSDKDDIDEVALQKVVESAGKLKGAIRKFKESAPPDLLSAISTHLQEIEKTLKNALSAPSAYLQKKKPLMKKVSFKPTPSED
jgi:hypothetical protein